jgi:hypothetical protein
MEITRSVQLTFINYYLLEILSILYFVKGQCRHKKMLKLYQWFKEHFVCHQFIKHRHGFMYSTSLVISYLWKKRMSSELNILFSKAMTFCMLHVLVFGTVQTMCYFWNCSDSVLFLELFRQCAIFGTVQTVCYFWNCSDSVLFLFSKAMTFCMLHVLVVVFWEATMNCLCSSNCITCINKTNIKTKMAHCLNSFKNSTLSEQFQK